MNASLRAKEDSELQEQVQDPSSAVLRSRLINLSTKNRLRDTFFSLKSRQVTCFYFFRQAEQDFKAGDRSPVTGPETGL